MADTKITALAAITTVAPANDLFAIVDVSDNSMAASGTTKNITTNQILGAGGTATLASATITGALTVDTTTLKVDATNHRVGIGTASPAVTFDVAGPIRSIVSGGIPYLYLNNGTSQHSIANDTNALSISVFAAEQMRIAASGVFTWYDGAGGTRMLLNSTGLGVGGNPASKLSIFAGVDGDVGLFRGGSTRQVQLGTSATAGYINTDNVSVGLEIRTNNVARVYVDTSGNVGIGVTPAGTGGCLQLKSGITFPATQVASSDANTLDDYEEGTWTGTLGGSTSNPTIPVTATGKYTKIGRQVSVQISFIAVDTTGASSRILVSGLPFASSSAPNGTIGSVLVDLMATFTGSPGVYLAPNGTQFDLYSSVSNGATSSITHNAGTARGLWINFTYTV